MTLAERQLLDVFARRSFQKGPTPGYFKLASGKTSDYYIDGRMSAVFSESAFLIGEVIYERTKSLKLDAIGGLEVGAVPLATAAAISYHLHGQKMEGFWVRDEAKKHGTQKLVEGGVRPGMRVAVIDDVFTEGRSAMKAVKAVQAMSCEVVLVLAIVDRLQGAEALFREAGIENYQSVFTIRDFGIAVPGDVQGQPLLG
jgi:orotate phosphoribosyltransferase